MTLYDTTTTRLPAAQQPSRRVLILRALNLGDLLVAVPALRAIRRRWPQHRVILATGRWLAPIVALTGAVDELLATDGLEPLPRQPARPWIAVNLHGAGPRSNAVLDALRPYHRIGHQAPGWDGPPWIEDQPERLRWCRMLAAHGVRADPDDLRLRKPHTVSPAPGAVVVHPGAAYRSRHWPLARYAAVAAVFAREGHRVVITGSAAERPIAAEVARRAWLPAGSVLAGRTPLATLAALIAEARLLVCPDTGVAHLSYAYATPSVVLFGPLPAWRWGPSPGGPHVPLSLDELRHGAPFAGEPDPAIRGIDPAAVVDAGQRLLARTPAYRDLSV
jgi:ADP-heptose:LPS heptosyltransferase